MSKTERKAAVLAVVSAMTEELSYLDEYLDGREGWEKTSEDIYENSGAGLRIVAKVFGVGKVNAAYGTADLITEHQPDLFINVGYAGGLIREAEKGDVAIGTDYVQVDFLPFFKNNLPQIAPSPEQLVKAISEEARRLDIPAYEGRIATGDFFLHDTEQKNAIIAEHSPIAFDMESAAVAQVASAKGVPFIALRTFSDLADDNAAEQALKNKHDRETGERIPIERRPVVLAVNTAERNAALIRK